MKKISFEDALILNGLKAARTLVRLLPFGLSLEIGWVCGMIAHLASPKRRRIAHRNLKAAFGATLSPLERGRIARRSAANLGVSIVEMLHSPDLDDLYLRRHLSFEGDQRVMPLLKQGRGVIFLTAHFGNWELLNVTANLHGFKMAVLARVQKHPLANEFLNGIRSARGSQVINRGMTIRQLLKALKEGRIVGILSDQDGGPGGRFVEFFGRLASMPAGVAAFALRTGAPVFPAFDFRENLTDHRIEVLGPLEVPDPSLPQEERERRMLQEYARTLEDAVRRSPEQWLWFHKRWKSTPDRTILILSDRKAGHLNQSKAVAEAVKAERAALGFAGRTRTEIIDVRFRSRAAGALFRALSLLLGGHPPFKGFLLWAALERSCYRKIMGTFCDVIISCGSSLAGVNLLVKHENQARAVAIMKPPFTAGFDAVLTPGHDGLKPGGNIFVTDTALTDLAGMDGAARGLERELSLPVGVPRIGFLVGGDGAGFRFDPRSFEELLVRLADALKGSRGRALVTTSRRTPEWAATLLKERLAGLCPFLVIANEANRPDAVRGILALSDAIIVTGESISMVSEAVASGKPVIAVLPGDARRLKPKVRRFLDGLSGANFLVQAAPDELDAALANRVRAQRPCVNGALKEAAKKVAG